MSSIFDDRLVQVTLNLPGGAVTLDQNLAIYITGAQYQAAALNDCQVKIFNLTKDQRNYILTETSPLKRPRTPIPLFIDVGRESYGTFRLFTGYVYASNSTQPPDIAITLIAITNSFLTGEILSNTQSSIAQLSVIAKNVADSNGLTLDFQATDKQIDNYVYSGSAAFEVQELNNAGGVVASVNNGVLTVVNAGQPNKTATRLINASNGMVGIPTVTDKGARVTIMLDNTVQLGNKVTIQSDILPSVNGDFLVQAIYFDIASRDRQFYMTLDCLYLQFTPFAGSL